MPSPFWWLLPWVYSCQISQSVHRPFVEPPCHIRIRVRLRGILARVLGVGCGAAWATGVGVVIGCACGGAWVAVGWAPPAGAVVACAVGAACCGGAVGLAAGAWPQAARRTIPLNSPADFNRRRRLINEPVSGFSMSNADLPFLNSVSIPRLSVVGSSREATPVCKEQAPGIHIEQPVGRAGHNLARALASPICRPAMDSIGHLLTARAKHRIRPSGVAVIPYACPRVNFGRPGARTPDALYERGIRYNGGPASG